MNSSYRNVVAALLFCAVAAMGETNWIDWGYGRPSVNVVTNAPSYRAFTSEVARLDNKVDNVVAGSGVTNHAELINTDWTSSGHSGTPARLAGFFEGGMAGYSALGPGLYFDGSDFLSLSNDIIVGAAAGSSALDRVAAVESNLADVAEAAAYAYSPTNQPFALTNILVSAVLEPGGWWRLYVITNGVKGEMQ